MDIKNPGVPLTARQVKLLADARLTLARPLPQLEYRTLAEFRADCNSFPAHFYPPNPGTLLWQVYGGRPVFRRLEALFPEALAHARDCIEINPAGLAKYRVKEGRWRYLFDVYRLMAHLVDADDQGGDIDEQHLVR